MITKLDHTFSGSYMCKVSSFVDEDFQQAEVMVVTPPRNIELLLYATGDRAKHPSLNVTCILEGVYPVPSVKMTWSDK